MRAAVLIPFCLGEPCPWRRRALNAILDHYRLNLPSLPVHVSYASGHPYDHSALNAQVEAIGADVVILNDSDSLVQPARIREAVVLAQSSGRVVKAFTGYRRLTREATERLYATPHAQPDAAFRLPAEDFNFVMETSVSHACLVVRRDSFLRTHGYDPKFSGWGYSDLAFDLVASAVLGDELRLPGDAIHLYHPPAVPNDANRVLFEERYLRHVKDAAALLELRLEPAQAAA